MSDTDPVKPVDEPAAAPVRQMPRSFAALESIPFRWLVSSLGTFFLAMQGQLVVRSLLAYELTQSPFALAMVNLVIATPMSIGLLFSGAIIDRVERRGLTIISQSIVLVNELVVLAAIGGRRSGILAPAGYGVYSWRELSLSDANTYGDDLLPGWS